jgi:poly-gamma-glutamate synthesis protein (capsule biosynthesis protein)
MHTGTFKTEEDSDELCIVDINGITFGFVAYTYATNGIAVPSDAPYCINTLELYDDEKLEEMYAKVRALDEAGVDFVCPLIHFGTEYSEAVDSWQEKVVDGLFENGADVIFGGHPHVVEPMDVRTITNPDGSTRTGYVIYSFGNFVSSQIYDGVNKDLGIIADFTFSKQVVNGDYVTKVEEIKVEPTYVYWTSSTIGVVPVLEAYNHPDNYDFLSSKDWGRIEFAKEHIIELLMEYGNLQYTEEDDKYIISPI